jgi:hypothetical protein
MQAVFLLLVLFQIKHFLCDYPLQGKFMLGKFKAGWDFLPPLLAHTCVHMLGTLVICASLGVAFDLGVKLIFMDGIIHFFMDRIKAGPKYLGRFKDMYDKKFWWSLGLDQAVHHLTHYLIIYLILR